MRFEELIVAQGGAEARLRLHSQMTVIGPMPTEERQELVAMLLAGASGGRAGVSLAMLDSLGEPLLATPDGTFRADGSACPDALGSPPPDAERLQHRVLITARDLGLAAGRSDPHAQAELDRARAALDDLRRRQETQPPQPGHGGPTDASIPQQRSAADELESLEARLRDAEEAEDRRAHFQARSRLADVEAELDVLEELAHTESADERLLGATAELARLAREGSDASSVERRSRDAVRRAAAILNGEALDGRAEHGPEDEADPLTQPLIAATASLSRASVRVRTLEVAVSDHTDADMATGLDRRIPLLAPLDQEELWEAHRRVRDVEHRFQALTTDREASDEIPAEMEEALDAAHIERIRAEETVANLWRPGILASSLLAVLGLAIASVQPILGCVFLLATIPVAVILLIRPRRALNAALTAERHQLDRVGASSYLGLHLRRLAAPDDDAAQKELAALAQERTREMVRWKRLVGHLEPAEADGIEAEIRGHALRFNAAQRAERSAALVEDLKTARLVFDECRAALRVAASQLENEVGRARTVATEAAAAAAALGDELGIEAGPHGEESLARERVAATQRGRVRQQARSHAAAEAERAELLATISLLGRSGWEGPPPLPPTPEAVSLLRRRRAELRSRLGLDSVAQTGHADIQARELCEMESEVRALQARLADQAGPDDVSDGAVIARRILARMARARGHGGGLAEGLPVIFDDPIVHLAADRRCDLLDMLLRLSARMQVIFLTEDPVAVGWARRSVSPDSLLLLEPVAEPA